MKADRCLPGTHDFGTKGSPLMICGNCGSAGIVITSLIPLENFTKEKKDERKNQRNRRRRKSR